MSKPEQRTDTAGTGRPHAELADWYAQETRRPAFLRDLFDANAADYGRLNRILSLGSGAWHRRRSLRRAGVGPGHRVLDVATGTGLVAREALALVGPGGLVLGLDPSAGMLREARRALPIPLLRGRAERLPIADASVDHLTMGYALRHVADLGGTFAEYRRVLRPGGGVLLLEFAQPANPVARAISAAVVGRALPALSRLLAGRGAGELMRYCWDTVRTAVAPGAILAALEGAGFAKARAETTLGTLITYTARRPTGD